MKSNSQQARNIQEGQSKQFYANGNLKALCHYLNNELHGSSTFYSTTGIALSQTLYHQGKQEGEARRYYLSGELYAIQRYREGHYHGLQEYFYSNGQLKTTMTYSHGKLTGVITLYHKDGSLKRQIQKA